MTGPGSPSAGFDPERVVSTSELATIVGVSPRWLVYLTSEGMPKIGRARFPLGASVRWLIDRWRSRAEPTPMAEARTRKAEADASSAEIDLARKRAAHADVEVIANALDRRRDHIRTRLLKIPAALAPRLRRLKTTAETESVIRAEMVRALTDLSEGGTA
jgi:phage terminase Nu1 subunit (DNA packaging protein)